MEIIKKRTVILFDSYENGADTAENLRARGLRCFLFKNLPDVEHYFNVEHDHIDYLLIGEEPCKANIPETKYVYFPLLIQDYIENLAIKNGNTFKTAMYSYFTTCEVNGIDVNFTSANTLLKGKFIRIIDKNDDNANQKLYDFLES